MLNYLGPYPNGTNFSFPNNSPAKFQGWGSRSERDCPQEMTKIKYFLFNECFLRNEKNSKCFVCVHFLLLSVSIGKKPDNNVVGVVSSHTRFPGRRLSSRTFYLVRKPGSLRKLRGKSSFCSCLQHLCCYAVVTHYTKSRLKHE